MTDLRGAELDEASWDAWLEHAPTPSGDDIVVLHALVVVLPSSFGGRSRVRRDTAEALGQLARDVTELLPGKRVPVVVEQRQQDLDEMHEAVRG